MAARLLDLANQFIGLQSCYRGNSNLCQQFEDQQNLPSLVGLTWSEQSFLNGTVGDRCVLSAVHPKTGCGLFIARARVRAHTCPARPPQS